MDSFEINKIVAAILLVALLIIGIGKLSNIIFYVKKPVASGKFISFKFSSVLTLTTLEFS